MDYTRITAYADDVYAAAIRKSGDSAVAQDIAQETFLAAFEALRRGKEPENPRAWLLRILEHKYCDWLRQKYNKPTVSMEAYAMELADVRDSAEKEGYETEWETVRRALGYLAKTHREVMVRFYLYGQPVERIAAELKLPTGTVKSRLHTGRRLVKERMMEMEQLENYGRQSYAPDLLFMSCCGGIGLDGEPLNLVKGDDRLAQSILLTAYEQPLTEADIAKIIGVPAAYIEPVAERLVEGELMRRTGSRIYTDFILFTEKDRTATLPHQTELANRCFPSFWTEMQRGLEELRQTDGYIRQRDHARQKLELHFCIHTLQRACLAIRDEQAGGTTPYDDYPCRKNGGRWFAMGNRKTADRLWPQPEPDYSINGEVGCVIRNFRGAKSVELREYDTALGRYPASCIKMGYIQWFYEIHSGISPEESTAAEYMLESVDSLTKQGILSKEEGLALDIPVMTTEEILAYRQLSERVRSQISGSVRNLLLPLYREGRVSLPRHLTGVPEWMRYMFCDSCVPLAVIYQAREKGLFLQGVDYPLPAAMLIIGQ